MDGCAIAAGFGPQRVCQILEGQPNIIDISMFGKLRQTLREHYMDAADPQNEAIVLDHIRGLSLLLADGNMPGLSARKSRSIKTIFKRYACRFSQALNVLPVDNPNATISDLTRVSMEEFTQKFPSLAQKTEPVTNAMLAFHQRAMVVLGSTESNVSFEFKNIFCDAGLTPDPL